MEYMDKIYRSRIDPNYFIEYHIQIEDFNKYWCFDFSKVFKNYDFVLIHELNIEYNPDKIHIVKDLLQSFCNEMTIQNKVVMLSLQDIRHNMYFVGSNKYEELSMIDEILIDCKFDSVDPNLELFFYMGSKLGQEVAINLEQAYWEVGFY